jgi:LPXTG-motif cell wall-anchored protein
VVTSTSSGSATIGDLDEGTYILKEKTAPVGYQALPEAGVTVTVGPGGVTYTLPGEGQQEQFATYDSENNTYVITVPNDTLPSAPVELLKIGDGDTTNVLVGAKFKLYYDEDLKRQVHFNPDGTNVGNGDGLIVTDQNGTAFIANLTPSTYYLKEIESAPGYQLMTKVESFTVNDDGTVYYESESYTAGPELYLKYTNGTTTEYLLPSTNVVTYTQQHPGMEFAGYQIIVNNTSGAALPMTGGIGTHWYVFGGLTLMLGAGLAVMQNRKRTLEPMRRQERRGGR